MRRDLQRNAPRLPVASHITMLVDSFPEASQNNPRNTASVRAKK